MENKEKYIIDQINNYRETVDTDDLWANVVGAIPQKEEKKRRGLIWFWGGLFLFSLISLFGYMLIDKSEGIRNFNGLQKNEKTIEESSPSIVNLTNPEDSNDIVNEKLEKELKQKSETEINAISRAKTETKEKNENQVLTSKSFLYDGAAKEFSQSVRNTVNEIGEDLIDGSYSVVNELDYNTKGLFIGTKQDSNTKVIIDRNENVLYLSPLGFSKLDYRRNLILNKAEFSKVDLLTEQSMKVNKWSLIINTGASFITRNLTSTDTESIDQRNRRDQIENVIGGWDVTAGLSYRLSPALSIASGLTFGQIHERSTYNTSYLIESEGQQITSIIHTQDGSVNSISENVTSYTNRESNEIRNNTLKYYSIPVILKYRLIENDKYRLSLNGTVAYSFSQRYTGFTSLDENQPAYDLALDMKNDFDRSGAISYGLGLDVSRRLSNVWDMNIGVGASRMQGISSTTNFIEQKYNLYTLKFGVSRKI